MISVFGANVGYEEITGITDSISSRWMGMGQKVKLFEERFSKHINADFLMLDSGSNSLLMAVKLLNIPKGSGIVLPSFTWVACAQSILMLGYKPIFADVDLETQNITVESIRKVITPDTKAIMVVHYAGKPVDMKPIIDLGLPIIEDAAHAVDSTLNGKICGTLGDIGIYSFDSVKNLATPEGGGITCKSKEDIEKVSYLRYCGLGKTGLQNTQSKSNRWWECEIKDIFPKTLPNDISASIGLIQLEKLKTNQARRKEIWDCYQNELNSISWMNLPKGPNDNETHSYFTYLVRVLDGTRDKLARYLLDSGIYTTLRYRPLHLDKIYDCNYKLPNCETLSEEGLNLPIHPNLSDNDLDYIIDKIRKFGESNGN